MVERLLLLTLGLLLLSGCDSEPRVFSELLVTNEHFIYPDVYPPQTAMEFRESVDLTASMVTFPYVLTAALRDPDVAGSKSVREAEFPTDWVREQLQVTTTSFSNSAFIRIAISNDVPAKEAATIVDAVTEAFQREVVDVDRQRKLNRLEELQATIRTEQSELSRLAQELRRRDKEVSAANKEQADLKFEMLNGIALELRKHLAKIEWEILSGEVVLDQLEADAQATGENRLETEGDQDESTEANDAYDYIVTVKATLARKKQLRARIKEELKARQIEVRDLGNLWVDRELQAEQVATHKARVEQLVSLAHKHEVELRHEEGHPPIKVIRTATAQGSGPDFTPYSARRREEASVAQRAALGNVAIGLASGVCISVLVGIALARRRKYGVNKT